MEIQLVLGPNNSGKSLYAEKLAVESGSKRIYLATMIPQNEEN
ncbi:bifunctional adenosylcobinamide kinase/adenosylcobinamide-phosphate guanylyltransferase, partial [Frisingicoccus sp.]